MKNFGKGGPGKDWFRPSNEEFFKRYGGGEERIITPIGDDELNQRTIVDLALDVSPSMQDHYKTLKQCFNEIMIPSFKQVVDEHGKTIRIGAVVFSNKTSPIWDGFRKITDVANRKLSDAIIQSADPGYTGLFRTMIHCLKHSATAATQANKSGEPSVPAKIKICILTDGANNLDPLDANEVKQITDKICDKSQVQLVLAYFNTGGGLSKKEFEEMAKATGFDHEVYYFDLTNGKTVEERARDFRRFFEILSDTLSKSIASM